jgi:predicted Zn-dependent protease
VFITHAAIELMENEAELAGVLAHEIAHVTQRHIVKALDIKSSAGASLVQVASGANDAFRVAFEQATDQALMLLHEEGLQHQDEYEADEVSALIVAQAGYDPLAYRHYLQRIATARPEQLQELSKTHPSITSRIKQLNSVHKENAIQNLDYPVMEQRFLTTVGE